MRYAIYLDDIEIENFFADEPTAIKLYDEYAERYGGEKVYDNLTLYAMRTVREGSLNTEEKDE